MKVSLCSVFVIVLCAGLFGQQWAAGQLSSGALRLKPTKTYERAINNSLKAEEDLNVCRSAAARAGENLADLACFENALKTFEWNATWCKQLAALAMMTAQRRLAYKHFNRSAQITLEAQGFINMTHVKDAPVIDPEIMLKLYWRRERAGGVELAKVWAQALQMDQQVSLAATILEEFVVPLDYLDEAIVVHRNIGNVVRAAELHYDSKRIDEVRAEEKKKQSAKKVKPKPSKLSKIVMLGEELGTSVEQLSIQWLSSGLTASPKGFQDANNHSKSVCGLGIPRKDLYTVNELVLYVTACIAKWGHFQEFLQKDKANLLRHYGAILRTIAHQLAAFNSDYLLRKLVEAEPSLLTERDNFGRTPLHQAVAHQHVRLIKTIVDIGGTKLLHEKDAGNISPLKMGCRTPTLREKLEKMDLGLPDPGQGRTICGEFGKEDRIHDESSEDYEELFSKGGGWKNTTQRFENEECDFDIITGDGVSHHELIGRYLHSSKPVVLRGVLPEQLINTLKKPNIRKNFGRVLVRRELYPVSEHFGVPIESIQNITTFLRNTTRAFGDIEMSNNHPLYSTLSWVPTKLFPPKPEAPVDEEDAAKKRKEDGYITLGDAYPLLVLSGANARTNYVARAQHFFFANVFGIQDWRLLPPPVAATGSNRVAFTQPDPNALRCRVVSGDVVIVPMLWGAAWKSRGEAAGFLTRFVWR
jgi:hypothetical protein